MEHTRKCCLVELEELQPIITSSTTHESEIRANQISTSTMSPAIDNQTDDFAEDEATALHDQPVSEVKPHLSQPKRQPPRRTSSVAQQLFERHNKDNRFKS